MTDRGMAIVGTGVSIVASMLCVAGLFAIGVMLWSCSTSGAPWWALAMVWSFGLACASFLLGGTVYTIYDTAMDWRKVRAARP